MCAYKNQSFLTRLRFALAGLLHSFRTERSFRWQSVAMLLVMIALVVLKPAPVWWALIIISSAAVLAAELFNTAIERLADHVHPEQHQQIRVVKDCAAAAVLCLAAGAVAVAVALVIDLTTR